MHPQRVRLASCVCLVLLCPLARVVFACAAADLSEWQGRYEAAVRYRDPPLTPHGRTQVAQAGRELQGATLHVRRSVCWHGMCAGTGGGASHAVGNAHRR